MTCIVDNVPHAKKIRNGNGNQLDQPTARNALQRPADNQHRHVDRRRADDGAAKEERHGRQQHGLPPPDVGQVRPDVGPRRVGEEVGASDPDVACCRVQVGGDGRDDCCDDGLVEGGDEEGELETSVGVHTFVNVEVG